MLYCLLTLILVTAFVSRAIPRFLQPYSVAPDGYFHLYLSKLILRHKRRCPKQDDRFIFNSLCTYPYYYHLIATLGGNKGIRWIERFGPALFDSLNTLIVFVFSFLIVNQLHLAQEIALIPALIFSVHPALFKLTDEPRAFNGGSRIMALTVYLGHLLALYNLYLNPESIFAYIVVILTAMILFNVTKFGIQVLVFFSIFFSILLPFYIPILILSFLVGAVISGGRTASILKIHLQHLIFLYNKKLYYRKFSPRTDLLNFLKALKSKAQLLRKLSLKDLAKSVFLENDPVYTIFLLYHSFVAIFMVDLYHVFAFFYVWMAGGISLFFLTKLPLLRFLGKAERYLEFSLVPTILILSLSLSRYPGTWILLLVYVLFCTAGIWIYAKEFLIRTKPENDEYPSLEEAFTKFNNETQPGIIWTFHQHFHKPIYFTTYPILGYFAGTINYQKSSQEELDDMMKNYPYPGFDLDRILQKYEVSYIICPRGHFEKYLDMVSLSKEAFFRENRLITETKSVLFISIR